LVVVLSIKEYVLVYVIEAIKEKCREFSAFSSSKQLARNEDFVK
jgi:hypothetical protein